MVEDKSIAERMARIKQFSEVTQANFDTLETTDIYEDNVQGLRSSIFAAEALEEKGVMGHHDHLGGTGDHTTDFLLRAG